jgi:hypothetical protein
MINKLVIKSLCRRSITTDAALSPLVYEEDYFVTEW